MSVKIAIRGNNTALQLIREILLRPLQKITAEQTLAIIDTHTVLTVLF